MMNSSSPVALTASLLPIWIGPVIGGRRTGVSGGSVTGGSPIGSGKEVLGGSIWNCLPLRDVGRATARAARARVAETTFMMS